MRRRSLGQAGLWAALACLSLGTALAGEATDVVTYLGPPDGDYRDAVVRERLDIGSAQTPAPNGLRITGALAVNGNGINGFLPGASGGRLTVRDTLEVRSNANASLLYVDPVANRVGIGTNAPLATLDVRGEVNTQILQGFTIPTQPYHGSCAEILNFVDAIPPTPPSVANGIAGVAGEPGVNQRFTYVYLDGDPLVFQHQPKTGTFGGPVVLNWQVGTSTAYMNGHSLIVGDPAHPKVVRAQSWYPPSSRAFKTDLQGLGADQLSRIYEDLSATQVYTYRYSAEAPEARRHTGYVAEEVPPYWITAHPTTIDVNQETSALAVSVSQLAVRQRDLERRIERLER